MNCILCNKPEINKITGKPHKHGMIKGRETTAFCCARCCQILTTAGISQIPWGGGIELKALLAGASNPATTEVVLKRRRV